jgi:hypothetical protein
MSKRVPSSPDQSAGLRIPKTARAPQTRTSAPDRVSETNVRGNQGTWLLLGLLAVAGILRFAQVHYGLPHIYHTDEVFEVKRALKLGAGQFDWSRSVKGGLYFILFVEYAAYFVILSVTGMIHSRSDFLVRFFADPTGFWMIGRCTVALLAVANLYALYKLGLRIRNQTTGLIAAAFLMFSTEHLWSSHFITVEILMLLLICLTLLQVMNVLDHGTWRAYLLAGLFASFATMTKFPAIVVILGLVVAHGIRTRREGRPFWRLGFDPRLGGAAAAFVVSMTVLNPGFWPTLLDIVRGLVGAGVGSDGEVDPFAIRTHSTWLFYIDALRQSLGLPVFLLSVAGLIRSLIRRNPADLVLLICFFATYVLISLPPAQQMVYARYSLPMQMVIVLFGADFLVTLAARTVPGRAAGPALATVVLLAIAAPAYGGVRTAIRLHHTDTRTLALRWVEANVPPSSRIVLPGRGYEASFGTVPLANRVENVRAIVAREAADDSRWSEGTTYGGLKDQFHAAACAALANERTYDLILITEDSPQRRLQDYLDEGAQYFIIAPNWYAQFLKGQNHEEFPLVGDFYRDVLTSDRLKRLARFDPEGRPGPALEIYGVLPEPEGADTTSAVPGGDASGAAAP